jgi:hypothetical protein
VVFHRTLIADTPTLFTPNLPPGNELHNPSKTNLVFLKFSFTLQLVLNQPMKTHTLNSYSYAELSPEAQAKARDWYRSTCDGDCSWSDLTLEDSKRLFAFVGFEIENILFSGFSSQGDGACFTGAWRAADVQPGKLAAESPQDEKLARLDREFSKLAAEFPQAVACITHRGRYSHQYCTHFAIDMTEDDVADTSDAEARLIECARDCMAWIYRTLEAEYEWQNADEQVADVIIANEYDFNADGSIF